MLRLAGGEGEAMVRRRVPRAELERLDGANRVIAALTDARLLTVSDGEVELAHEALVREWPRYRIWLDEDRVGRRLHAHLVGSARDWDATGRDPGDLYRGARLTAALDWAGQHGDELRPIERRYVDASRRHAERNARRLRAGFAGVALLLLASFVAGVVALVQKQHARTEARVALARQLGAQAVSEPRLDVAMLLAREAVSLDRSPETEGSLLATLQRTPAVVRSLAVASDGPAQVLGVSPDGRTVAVGLLGPPFGVRFYDARTLSVKGGSLSDFGGARSPVYSRDGSLLAYSVVPTDGPWSAAGLDLMPSIVVRDANTGRLLRKLIPDPLQLAGSWPDMTDAHIMIAPDGKTLDGAYQEFSPGANAPESTSLTVVAAQRAATLDQSDRRRGGARGRSEQRGCACRRR